MKAKHLAILMISSFCVIIVALYYLIMNAAFGNMCENFIVLETSSDKYTATVFTRGCGATTSDYPYINIRKNDEGFDSEGSSNKQVFLSINSEQNLTRWKDNSILVIECQDCLTDGIDKSNFNAKKIFQDLKIETRDPNSK